MRRHQLFIISVLVFGAFYSSPAQAAEPTRYLVKSDKALLKSTLGVRHSFQDGFTTDLSDLQLHFVKLFGIDVEPVAIAHILPADIVDDSAPKTKTISKAAKRSIRPIPTDQTPWGIEAIYDDPLISVTSGGDNVTVAVLDTGVAVDHPDLKNRISICRDTTSVRGIVDGKCTDRNGHGTHVAGIIAADAGADGKGIYGVAPAARIAAYKVCQDNGSCFADDIAAGIIDAADQNLQIINMSFGSDAEIPLIASAIRYAQSKDVLMIAAAGNDGPFPDSIDYPARYPEVVGVGALDKSLSVTDWSSRGNNSHTTPAIVELGDIEYAAPGERIESTSKDGGYLVLSGTSMAAPFISGLAAKYWDVSATSHAQSTRDLLRTMAHDIAPFGEDDASGFGFPQVTH